MKNKSCCDNNYHFRNALSVRFRSSISFTGCQLCSGIANIRSATASAAILTLWCDHQQ